jgi:hypothetical protein
MTCTRQKHDTTPTLDSFKEYAVVKVVHLSASSIIAFITAEPTPLFCTCPITASPNIAACLLRICVFPNKLICPIIHRYQQLPTEYRPHFIDLKAFNAKLSLLGVSDATVWKL